MIENIDRLTCQNCPGKEEQGHVWSSPRPIDCKETQAGTGQTIEVGIGMRHQLVGFLTRGIEGNRVVDVVMHGKRHPGVCTIDRRRRSVDEVADLLLPATFQDVHKTDDIGIDIGMRIGQGVTDTGLGCKIDHDIKLMFNKEFFDTGPISDIRFYK